MAVRRLRKAVRRMLWLMLILIIGFVIKGGIDAYYDRMYPTKYEAYVQQYSAMYGVEESLIYAVIKTESDFDPNATSNQQAKGLMQVTGETFDWLSIKMGVQGQYQEDDLYDPEVAIKFGTYFLSYLLHEFETLTEVLAAYHAGRGITGEWLKNPAYSTDGIHLDDIPYPKTAHYVQKVLKNYQEYHKRRLSSASSYHNR